jgi:3-dehydroquinate synthase/shikimate kinase/3-dehydroquinate synthase
VIVLVGFMGAGKTTIGRSLADELGLPFVDTDAAIENADGRPVKEIFESDGEGHFRSVERDVVARILGGPESVVSVGGGAIHDPSTCAALEWHDVIYLDVSYPEAMRRVGQDPGRPMLHFADPRALFDERRPIYTRLARHQIDTTGASPEEVVQMVIHAAALKRADEPAPVMVELGDRSYPVLVGRDISRDVGQLMDATGAAQGFLITHPHLAAAAKPAIDSFVSAGVRVTTLFVDEGETTKSFEIAVRILEDIAAAKAHRSDLVICFGGGVVCDLGGFIASTYHRGMRVVHIPTTLLAQVDAAVGGKTALNLPVGKNLVGTFHQPAAVVCDVALLRSLPDEEIRSGMAEVLKYGFISDPSLLDLATSEVGKVFDRDEELFEKLVRRSVAIKAAIVSSDEREKGRREILNYGHTFGHAIEHVTGVRHGEAISIGMMAAAHVAVDVGLLDETAIERHRAALKAFGLPVSIDMDVSAVLAALGQDKKHRAGLRFVLLEKIGAARAGVEVEIDKVEAALRSVTR